MLTFFDLKIVTTLSAIPSTRQNIINLSYTHALLECCFLFLNSFDIFSLFEGNRLENDGCLVENKR